MRAVCGGWLCPRLVRICPFNVGDAVSEDFSKDLYDEMHIHCPDCLQHEGFYMGPRGGLAINVYCRNPACRSGFNVVPVMKLAQHIGKCTLPYPGDADRTSNEQRIIRHRQGMSGNQTIRLKPNVRRQPLDS